MTLTATGLLYMTLFRCTTDMWYDSDVEDIIGPQQIPHAAVNLLNIQMAANLAQYFIVHKRFERAN